MIEAGAGMLQLIVPAPASPQPDDLFGAFLALLVPASRPALLCVFPLAARTLSTNR